MARFRKTMKGKFSAKRTRLGNLVVGTRKGNTPRETAKELGSTANLFAHTKKAKKFRASQRRALESAIKRTER